ncbi:MAG: epoxyqueuosine reductase QueH [Candidatus Marinimicrobia bacterium]|nr:epoxyqueuosine reductase QueH [Candidatus Neomarinimicrobiota bacterium]
MEQHEHSNPRYLEDRERRPMTRVLLHTCCAVCAAACAERLREEGMEPVLFFSNSNIYPKEEYDKRLNAAEKLAELQGLELVVDDYDHEAWREAVKGLEQEPEKGARCAVCFDFSFRRTAEYARRHGFDSFTSTLSVSPHKVSRMIFDAGKKYAGFREDDFKKRDGFKRSRQLSRELELYHQDYCGCEFSLKEAEKRKKGNKK